MGMRPCCQVWQHGQRQRAIGPPSARHDDAWLGGVTRCTWRRLLPALAQVRHKTTSDRWPERSRGPTPRLIDIVVSGSYGSIEPSLSAVCDDRLEALRVACEFNRRTFGRLHQPITPLIATVPAFNYTA